jgi:hypothetical protein
MNNDEFILAALKLANKAGARGQEVIGFIWPGSAADDPGISLITRTPEKETASEKPWYL